MTAGPRMRLAALFAALLLAALALGTGCVGPVPHVRGDFDTTLDVSLASVTRAAQMTVVQLDYTPVIDRADDQRATLIVRNAAGQSLEIHLGRLDVASTQLKIRTGLADDAELHRAILDRIIANI